MFSIDEDYLIKQFIPLTMMSGSLRKLGQYQGKQELLLYRRPELLKTLKDIAIIQSAESSNRIEGITVEADRLQKMLDKNFKPQNRPEAEVLGYREVLSDIHSNYNFIEISTETILKMHKDIYRYTENSGGHWKIKDNYIEEKLANGQWVTRFEPIAATQTPHYMNELCQRFQRLWHNKTIDPLILVFAFIFDFLCIHPFTDGNGRISRLLSVLLLHKINFDVPRYISYERLIENTKESYYEVLQEASKGWHQSQHRLTSWLEYNIGILIAAYKELEERIEIIDHKKGSKTSWILEAINSLPQEFSIGELAQICQGISRPMIRHILEQQREAGKLKSIGSGRSAKWCKIL